MKDNYGKWWPETHRRFTLKQIRGIRIRWFLAGMGSMFWVLYLLGWYWGY